MPPASVAHVAVLGECPLPLFDVQMSVLDLIATRTLPLMDPAPSTSSPVPFPLSRVEAEFGMEELEHRPLPHSSIITRTFDHLRAGHEHPVRSLLDTRFQPPRATPVWILRYWMRCELAVSARRLWSDIHDCLEHLHLSHPNTGPARDDISTVLVALGSLPWHGELCAEPFVHTRHMVAMLLGEPVPADVVDIMLHIMRRDLRSIHPTLASQMVIHSIDLQHILESLVGDHLMGNMSEPGDNTIASRLALPLAGSPPHVAHVYLPWLSNGSFHLYVLDSARRIIRHGSMGGGVAVPADVDLIKRWLPN